MPRSASVEMAADTLAVRASRSAAASTQGADGSHHLRAVEERQALLGLEDERLEAVRARAPRQRASADPSSSDLAAADERQRQVGEGRQVARGAHAALRRHDRVEAQVAACRRAAR